MDKKLTCRRLDFSDLGQVVRDAELLAAAGYDKAGNWDLAQVCGHLTEWMRFPLDGFPRSGLPVRLMLWALRRPVPVAVEDVDAAVHLCALAPPDGQRQQEQYVPQPARLVLAGNAGRDRDAALPGRPGRGSSRR